MGFLPKNEVNVLNPPSIVSLHPWYEANLSSHCTLSSLTKIDLSMCTKSNTYSMTNAWYTLVLNIPISASNIVLVTLSSILYENTQKTLAKNALLFSKKLFFFFMKNKNSESIQENQTESYWDICIVG